MENPDTERRPVTKQLLFNKVKKIAAEQSGYKSSLKGIKRRWHLCTNKW